MVLCVLKFNSIEALAFIGRQHICLFERRMYAVVAVPDGSQIVTHWDNRSRERDKA